MNAPSRDCIADAWPNSQLTSISRRVWLAQSAFAIATGMASAVCQSASADDSPLKKKSKFNRVLAVGDEAPQLDGLLGTDGKRHSLDDFADKKAVLVMFIRNLCPTTHAYEPRLLEFAKRHDETVGILAVSVSRNPAEGLDRMAARAKSKKYPWIYALDETQFAGRLYGASVTPQFFLLDEQRTIAYMGAFDDNFVAEKVTVNFLEDATKARLAGEPPKITETLARGCEIEYTDE